MTANHPLGSGRTPKLAVRVMTGAAVLASLLLTVGPAAAGTRSDRNDGPGDHLLPSSVAGLAPVLEQHSRGGGGGGGHAVPRGGSGGGAPPGGGSPSGGGTRSGAPAGGGSPTGQPASGGAQPKTQGGTTASQGGDPGDGTTGTPTYSKPRDGKPATGTAVRRQPGDVPPVVPIGGGGYYPIYYPWGWAGLGVGAYYGGYDPWGWGDPSSGGGTYDYDGKLKLKVKPRQAEVLVDGYFSGSVDDYDGTFQELHLEPGPHRIEIRMEGYETLSFEVRILPDQTVTYRGELRKRDVTDTSAGASTDRPELPER